MLWILVAFALSIVLAFWNKGFYVYLLYTLLYELVLFAALNISPKKRYKIVGASIAGYLVGSLLFYSTLFWTQTPERNTIGKETEKYLSKMKESYHSTFLPF
ncbi:putative transmembrane protein [Cedratvirus kamchatka]|uniref:Transmembrane protein n=1 Tax=Cedratvirus kamchatka TaxID=2716914 RepID=A0A6G8MX97_9VIRU|nr:putative transmembrane protein [Cedratvirus kamchatka]WIL04531.1 putative membrane protein [Cedratvirus duvanny]